MEVTEWEEAKNGSCCKDYQRIFTILGLLFAIAVQLYCYILIVTWAFLAAYGIVRLAERCGFLL